MKKELAESLLAQIMDWSDAEKATQRARLESFASYKYDEYQQFSPGRRFIESLALWLGQFDKGTQRRVAYDFICNRLIFISFSEMNHLVELAFPTIIRPMLIADTAHEIGLSPARIKTIVTRPEYRSRLRRTLVLGMSDGARTDWFRRANPMISNEQVFHAYDVSDVKAEEMVKKLGKHLKSILGRPPNAGEALFEYLVLLDDFTASGTSAIRPDGDGWDGKIPKIIEMVCKSDGLGATVVQSGLKVIIIAYVASDQAISHIKQYLEKLPFEKGSVQFQVVFELGPKAPLNDIDDAEILKIATDARFFDPSVDDEHAAVGGTSKRLGYANGRLPVVLSHNTPNNSIYLLWAEDVQSVLGLFPRVSRHRKLQQP